MHEEKSRGSGLESRKTRLEVTGRGTREVAASGKRVGTLAPVTARCKIRLVGLLRDGSRRSWCRSASLVASGLVVCLLFRPPSRAHLVDPAFSCPSCLRARTFVSDCRVMNSNPGFGRGFSCREPVDQNGVLKTAKACLKEKLRADSKTRLWWSRQAVRTRTWTLVGARMLAFGLRGLGVSTFPWGCVTDTREKESPLIILRPESREQIIYPGSRGMEHLVVVKALVCAEPKSPCSGVHVMCGPISRTPFRYSDLLGLHVLLFTS
ncbi:hypothetical protein CRG98_045422 [Punica granatum]|uniref:Uncharacterized protein n=1 Tax=Punica granatum TaxID=22663 RepID=A0A2I0HR52_PUNGR|nr:hypothetical protein CRG98_045422 [Punica granatum]